MMAAYVPSLFWYEVASVLYVNEPKGRITASLADEFLRDLLMLPLDDIQPQDIHQVLKLARKHRITPYDAAYLELALRNQSMLATLDRKLQEAARSEGVTLLSAGRD